MSLLVKPMRTSLTPGEGDFKIPSFKRSPVIDDWPESSRGIGVGLVLKRGSIVGELAEEFVVSPGGIYHDPCPAMSSSPSTVCGVAFRVA